MNCGRFRRDLPLFASDDLSGERRDELRKHLVSCQACRARLERFRADRKMLLRLDVEPVGDDETFHRQLLRRLDTLGTPRMPRTRRFAGVALQVAAAVLIVGLLVLGQRFWFGESSAPESEVKPSVAGTEERFIVRPISGPYLFSRSFPVPDGDAVLTDTSRLIHNSPRWHVRQIVYDDVPDGSF